MHIRIKHISPFARISIITFSSWVCNVDKIRGQSSAVCSVGGYVENGVQNTDFGNYILNVNFVPSITSQRKKGIMKHSSNKVIPLGYYHSYKNSYGMVV